MKNLVRLSDISVVIGLLLLSAFFLVRLWIGWDPSNPLVWQAFLSAPSIIREPANLVYYSTDVSPQSYALIFFGLAILGGFLSLSKKLLRLKFIYFHAALILFVTGLVNEYVNSMYSPSLMDDAVVHVLLYFKNLHVFQLLMLSLFLTSCLNCHRKILMSVNSRSEGSIRAARRPLTRVVGELPRLLGILPVAEDEGIRTRPEGLAAVRGSRLLPRSS